MQIAHGKSARLDWCMCEQEPNLTRAIMSQLGLRSGYDVYWFQVLHTATAAFGYFCYKWEENTLQIGHSKSGRLDY